MKLKHLLLYSKGWYPKTDDIWNDLHIILRLDGYNPFLNEDCLKIILNNLPPNFTPFQTVKILLAIHPASCWRFGYIVKGDNYWLGTDKSAVEYHYDTAIVKYIVSELRFIEKEYYDTLPTPNVDEYYSLIEKLK